MDRAISTNSDIGVESKDAHHKPPFLSMNDKLGPPAQMKRFLIILVPLLLLAAAVIGAARIGLLPQGTPLDYFSPQASFVRRWHSELRGCRDALSAQASLKNNKEGGEAVMVADGSWTAIVMEHDCCTGAGFNATLYVTSAGEAYLDAESCYCGWLPLGEEIYEYPKISVAGFLAAVRASGKPLTRL